MTRDSQAALVALNRFGFGARGGASGDFVNAATDPRGFVKSELGRPNGALFEVPGLQSTPALGEAVFAYQEEQKKAREAKAGAPASEGAPQPFPADANARMREPSLANAASDVSGKDAGMKPAESASAAQPNAAMQQDATKQAVQAQQPQNVIQKTFRAEALARLQRAVLADCGFTERLVTFWSNHFC
ncbi:MAG: DUF1800 family protein, partial [Bradyrhizobium sp.]|nr:DUF1800 family protein [Bradyrhizobium sp.]